MINKSLNSKKGKVFFIKVIIPLMLELTQLF